LGEGEQYVKWRTSPDWACGSTGRGAVHVLLLSLIGVRDGGSSGNSTFQPLSTPGVW